MAKKANSDYNTLLMVVDEDKAALAEERRIHQHELHDREAEIAALQREFDIRRRDLQSNVNAAMLHTIENAEKTGFL